MTRQEGLVWERILQFWAVLFCLTMVRYSGWVTVILPSAGSPAEPYIAILATWLVAGLLSMAFLCRLAGCGEIEDLGQRQVNVRIAASIPLGVVALVHSLYQLHRRKL